MSAELTIRDQAAAIARSGLFGLRDETQVLALMAVAQSQGRHPASVAQEYSIIQGRPALKADAMLARFQAAGGSVRWSCLTDERAEATFSHPQGGSLQLDWTIERARAAGLTTKGGPWKNYPRAMLRARLISEGIRSVFPGVVQGEYAVEEVQDMVPASAPPRALFAPPLASPVESPLPDLSLDDRLQAALKEVAARHGRERVEAMLREYDATRTADMPDDDKQALLADAAEVLAQAETEEKQ